MNGAFNDTYIKYKSKGDENTPVEQYHEKIRPYLGDMIDKFKKSGEWKIQSTMNVNFIQANDNDDKLCIQKVMTQKS